MARNLILAFAACVGLLAPAGALRAESLPEGTADQVSSQRAASSDPAHSASHRETSAPVATIALARPIGRVSLAADAQLVGETRYADRRGNGAIRFVTARPRPAFTGSLPGQLPVTGTLTSGYGMRTHPLFGGRRWHGGVDLAAPAGTPVRATSDGVVVAAGWTGGYGLLVELSHGGDVSTRYGHLRRILVKVGQAVSRGDVIGQVGSTGNSTGPHVHYELRTGGRPVDPMAR